MKIIFAGTPEFASVILKSLIDSEHEIVAVLTQPDRPSGRGRKLSSSAVKQVALDNSLSVYQPLNLSDKSDQTVLQELNADIMVVVAYGIILPKAILSIPKYGCFNIHASLLPRWRGAAPIQRAILAGDKETGITIMQMDKGLDTGDMLLTKHYQIQGNDTATLLHDKLADIGAKTLLEALKLLDIKQLSPIKQNNDDATYAHKLVKSEALINWNDSNINIANKIKAFNSWPVASTFFNKKPLRIWNADIIDNFNQQKNSSEYANGLVVEENKQGCIVSCGKGFINITEIQLPNKKRILIKDFINSNSFFEINFNL